MKKIKEKVVACSLPESEYNRFRNLVDGRGTGFTEELIVGIATLLTDSEIKIARKPKSIESKKTLTARVSRYFYDRIKQFAKSKECSISDLLYLVVCRGIEE